MAKVAKARFTDYDTTVAAALDTIDAAEGLPQNGLIIIKPNLTNSSPPPVTTPVAAAEAVYKYCKAHSSAEVAFGEGCGSGTTPEVYAATGYTELAEREGIRLIDFNTAESVELSRSDALQLKTFHLPRVAQDAFIISLPVLKDHSFTVTTIAMKNMFGLAPAPFYEGSWNKSKLHSPSTHKSVFDVCLYRLPDLCVIDAVVALAGMHLSGTKKKLGLVLASFDPVAADAVGSKLLGHDPRKIEYLGLANGILGDMDSTEIVEA